MRLEVLSLGPSYVEGIVLEDDLKKFLIQNTEGLQDANVVINNDRIALTGTANIMGFFGKEQLIWKAPCS